MEKVDMQHALTELTNRESSTNSALSLYPQLVTRLFAASNLPAPLERFLFELDPSALPHRQFKRQLAHAMLPSSAGLRLRMHVDHGLRAVFCRHGAMQHHSRLLKPAGATGGQPHTQSHGGGGGGGGHGEEGMRARCEIAHNGSLV